MAACGFLMNLRCHDRSLNAARHRLLNRTLAGLTVNTTLKLDAAEPQSLSRTAFRVVRFAQFTNARVSSGSGAGIECQSKYPPIQICLDAAHAPVGDYH